MRAISPAHCHFNFCELVGDLRPFTDLLVSNYVTLFFARHKPGHCVRRSNDIFKVAGSLHDTRVENDSRQLRSMSEFINGLGAWFRTNNQISTD